MTDPAFSLGGLDGGIVGRSITRVVKRLVVKRREMTSCALELMDDPK